MQKDFPAAAMFWLQLHGACCHHRPSEVSRKQQQSKLRQLTLSLPRLQTAPNQSPCSGTFRPSWKPMFPASKSLMPAPALPRLLAWQAMSRPPMLSSQHRVGKVAAGLPQFRGEYGSSPFGAADRALLQWRLGSDPASNEPPRDSAE